MSATHKQLMSPQPVDGVAPVNAGASVSRFSRLRLAAASPDWMSSLSQPQAARSTPMAPPAPVATTTANSAATAATPRSVGFLSMFYRGTAPLAAAPQPPVALGGPSTPPLRPVAIPVDVALSLDATAAGRSQTAEVRIVSPIRRTDGLRAPMALGSETWNALGGVSAAVVQPMAKPVRHASTATTPMTAPAPIDATLPSVTATASAARAAPQPLGAPTLEAFRRSPMPPHPLTASPTRDDHSTVEAYNSGSAAAPVPPLVSPAAECMAMTAPRGLRPVGEDDAPLTPVMRSTANSAATIASPAPAEYTGRTFFRGAQVRPVAPNAAAANPFAGLTFATMLHSDSDSGPDDESFAMAADVAVAQSTNCAAAAVVGSTATPGFLSSLFSAVGSPSAPAQNEQAAPAVSKSATARLTEALLSFNALELATGSRSKTSAATTAGTTNGKAPTPMATKADALPQEPTQDYSAYLSKAFDELDDDGEESLDDLKRVVSIVMQGARQQQQQQSIVDASAVRSASPSVTVRNGSDRGKGGRPASGCGSGGNNTLSLFLGGSEGSAMMGWAKSTGSAMLQGI